MNRAVIVRSLLEVLCATNAKRTPAAAALHACGTAAHHPVMAEIYRCAQLAHRHEAREAYEVLSSVRSRYFPESDFLLEAMARALYAAQDYDGAQGIYESLYSRDEHNLTGVDTYSNILYVKERYEELSVMHHQEREKPQKAWPSP